jgi:hypothetical protein
MPANNPAVYCGLHAEQFVKTDESVENDGTQTLITQTWVAPCKCAIQITLALPAVEAKQ